MQSEKGLYIIMIYADSPREWNCSQWRSLSPADAINRSNVHTAKLIHVSGFTDYLAPQIQELIAPADIIIFQRNLVDEQVFNAIHYWRGMGKPIAVDLDDAYHILPWSNPAHKYWIEKNDSTAVDRLEYGLSLCDGLVAPNRLLLEDWKHVVRGYFLDNYSEKGWWENLKTREEIKEERGLSDRIVIGWGGSVSHYDSWHGSGIFDAAKAVSQEFPNVTWMICGNDDRIYQHLPVPSRQKILQPGVPPNQWPQIVKTFDIGVAPLYGPYDQRRSRIKGLEYLHAGVPWIGTIGEPYRELADLGILIENSAENWENTLTNMIRHLDDEQNKAASRIEFSHQWFADNQTDTFVQVYRNIIRDFKEENEFLPGVVYVSPDQQ